MTEDLKKWYWNISFKLRRDPGAYQKELQERAAAADAALRKVCSDLDAKIT